MVLIIGRVFCKSQKALSAKRCIKTAANVVMAVCAVLSQKALSAKRCIKTKVNREDEMVHSVVRKH